MRTFGIAALLVCALTVVWRPTTSADEVRYTGPSRVLHKHAVVKAEPVGPSTADFPRAYPWGYFGAQPGRYKVYHRGYYGHYMEWGYRRAY